MTTRPVPVNLFTGFFGTGKTTAIRNLLASKGPAERWAVLINEFGEVAVDGAALDVGGDDGVVIQEIPGGCLCCSTNVPLNTAVSDILDRARPDRLIIEPTGIGHPAGIIDELGGDALKGILDLRAVICLVDPRHATDPRLQEVALFRDQVHLADVLIANKADLASADELSRFDDWAMELFPAKLHVGTAVQGALDPQLLDLGGAARAPLFPDLHAHDHEHGSGKPSPSDVIPRPGQPTRLENEGGGYAGCGWIFSAKDMFDRDALLDLLGPPGPPHVPAGSLARLKGVFRVNDGWLLIDRVGNEVTAMPIAYRRDSLLEIIVKKGAAPDWRHIEKELVGTIVSQPANP